MLKYTWVIHKDKDWKYISMSPSEWLEKKVLELLVKVFNLI